MLWQLPGDIPLNCKYPGQTGSVCPPSSQSNINLPNCSHRFGAQAAFREDFFCSLDILSVPSSIADLANCNSVQT